MQAVRDHLAVLRSEGLATDRDPLVMRASDGTLLEIFEWRSRQAMQEAHSNEAVLELWSRFEEACEARPKEIDLTGLPQWPDEFQPPWILEKYFSGR